MPRIFVVDDEPHILRLVQKWLEDAGYEVDTAANGVEALARMRENRPDLLVSDNYMPEPEMDGLELVTTVRNDPALEDLPVIVMTAKASDPDVLMPIYAADANLFLTKPFNPSELVGMIRRLLGEEVEAEKVEEDEAETPEPAKRQAEGLWQRLFGWTR